MVQSCPSIRQRTYSVSDDFTNTNNQSSTRNTIDVVPIVSTSKQQQYVVTRVDSKLRYPKKRIPLNLTKHRDQKLWKNAIYALPSGRRISLLNVTQWTFIKNTSQRQITHLSILLLLMLLLLQMHPLRPIDGFTIQLPHSCSLNGNYYGRRMCTSHPTGLLNSIWLPTIITHMNGMMKQHIPTTSSITTTTRITSSSSMLLLFMSPPDDTTSTNQQQQPQSSPSRNSNSSSSSDDEKEWNAVLAGFQMYQAAYGDLKVPQRFVVPNMAPWPKNAWGLKLGKVVSAIRLTGRYISSSSSSTNQSQQRKQILDQMGFVWSVRRSSDEDEMLVLDSVDSVPSTTGLIGSNTGSNAAARKASSSGIRLEQIITALELYKSIVGNTVDTIADNYVVPDTDAWPESVRGLPLGRQLEMIKRSQNTNIRNKFAALGVPMEPLISDNISNTPNGGGAGAAAAAAVKPTDASPSSHPPTQRQPPTDIAKALEKAWDGYPDGPSANDIRFQNVYTALVTYLKLYDDLLIPQPFVVPKDPMWPEEIWGLRLGARVNAIRSQGTFVNNNPARRQLLNEIGFVWNPPKERRRGRKTRDDNFDTDIDESTNGDTSMLFDGTFDFGKDFEDVSFEDGGDGKSAPSLNWNLDGARMPDTSTMTSSDDTKDSDEYKPPRSWAESLAEATERALDIGIIDGLTPTKRVIKGKREKNIPWFNDDFGGDFSFEHVVEALTVYKSIYGDFSGLTDSDFVVPAAKEITGFLDMDNIETFDIDASARAAAAIASYKEQGQLDRSADLVAAEINRLQQQEDQSLEIRTKSAMLAAEAYADQWPEHLAGMRIGGLVTRIRDGSLEVKHLPDRKAKLDAIGFDWGDPKHFIDVPFEKAVCAMYAYYLVRGDLFVSEDFLMPDEDPWPQALAGYEIGKAVKRLRELQNFLEAYHPEKVGLLRMIDFVWFADTMALPLDSNEKEMDSETLLLCAMGHPDFAKMIDIPMGLPDKIVADGPFYETDDDPKLWWRKWHNWEYAKDYWYQQGRRDNGFALRAMGYPKMADEHEAKYGPGLFTQIDKVMADLDNGALSGMGPEEKTDVLEKLNYFRKEMLGCTDIHPIDRDMLLSELDTQMLIIMKSASMDISIADEFDKAVHEPEPANGVERKRTTLNRLLATDDNEQMEQEDMEADDIDTDREDDDIDDDDGLIEEEEFDVEDELGLGGEEW